MIALKLFLFLLTQLHISVISMIAFDSHSREIWRRQRRELRSHVRLVGGLTQRKAFQMPRMERRTLSDVLSFSGGLGEELSIHF